MKNKTKLLVAAKIFEFRNDPYTIEKTLKVYSIEPNGTKVLLLRILFDDKQKFLNEIDAYIKKYQLTDTSIYKDDAIRAEWNRILDDFNIKVTPLE